MNQVLCSMALGLSVTIRKTGTTLAPKKGLLWGSNGGGWQLLEVDPLQAQQPRLPLPQHALYTPLAAHPPPPPARW